MAVRTISLHIYTSHTRISAQINSDNTETDVRYDLSLNVLMLASRQTLGLVQMRGAAVASFAAQS